MDSSDQGFEYRSMTAAPLPWEATLGETTEHIPRVPLWVAVASTTYFIGSNLPQSGAVEASDTTASVAVPSLRQDFGWSTLTTAHIPVALSGLRDLDWHLEQDELAF